jgi:WD40 repeat protein
VPTCAGFVAGGSTEVVGHTAAFLNGCDGETTARTFVVDLVSQKIVANFPGQVHQSQALSPDGKRILRQDGTETLSGPLRIYDAGTGTALLELQDMCTWESRDDAGCNPFPQTPFAFADFSLAWSPDGTKVAAIDDDTGVMAAWDAISGKLLKAQEGPPFFWDLTFTPKSDELIVSSGDGELLAFSTDTWQISRRSKLDPSIFAARNVGFAGFLPDARTLVGVGGFQAQGGGSLLLIDLATLTVRESHPASDGSPKSMAVSPDGKLAVIGASDGLVRVWDLATGTVLHEFQVKGQAQGVAFEGNDRLVIILQVGTILIMTIDPNELIQVTRASLSRGFTADECARFNFGDQCPTLDQLRSSSPQP